jgi:hypothetical protein
VRKKTVGIRVTAEEVFEGLDITEHGMPAYNGLDVEESVAHTAAGLRTQTPMFPSSQPVINIKK